jgi:hypothetical protein
LTRSHISQEAAIEQAYFGNEMRGNEDHKEEQPIGIAKYCNKGPLPNVPTMQHPPEEALDELLIEFVQVKDLHAATSKLPLNGCLKWFLNAAARFLFKAKKVRPTWHCDSILSIDIVILLRIDYY